jgi:hypothetical protein
MNETIPYKHRLKLWLGQSDRLYSQYVKLRNPDKRFPQADTYLTIEGFPRSANTFSIYLARELFPESLISSHIHNIASIKAGLRINAPCLILILDGVESVVSLAQKNGIEPSNTKILAGYMQQWILMYTFVEKHIDQLPLVDFRQLVRMPEKFVCLMAKLRSKTISMDEAATIVSSARAKMEAKEANKPEQGSSLPKKERDGQRAAHFEAVRALKSSQVAKEMFQSLSEKSLDLNNV